MDNRYNFTIRELEILSHVAKAMTRKQIVAELKFKSARTLDSHLRNIYNKCNIRPYAALVLFAFENGYDDYQKPC
jgi:DNA-binding NarL/FixJ family response regulator